MMPQTAVRKPNRSKAVRVGSRVRFPWSVYVVEGQVIEDRGFIGVGGRQIIRVVFNLDPPNTDPENFITTEIPAEHAEIIMPEAAAA